MIKSGEWLAVRLIFYKDLFDSWIVFYKCVISTIRQLSGLLCIPQLVKLGERLILQMYMTAISGNAVMICKKHLKK